GVREALLGIDARTGRVRVRRTIAGVSFAPPTVVDGRLFLATMHGLSARPFPVAHGRPATELPEYASRLDGRHAWQSREDGVYAPDDGGKAWRRISPSYAVRVVRLSVRDGVIAVGTPAPACGCATRRLQTHDAGRTWRAAPGVGENFQGRGS